MKKLLLLLLLVTINVTAQNNPAKFRDGIKTPFIQYENLTTNEKLAIPQVEGTLVYDTDLNRLQIYNGNVWVNFFDNTIDTSDDIIEGFNNNFLTADERAKLLNLDNTTNNTFVGLSAGNGVTAGGVTATGIDAAQNSTGANITATGNGAAQGAQGANITVHGANAGGGAIGTGIVGVGSSASRYARGNDITTVGKGAGGFLIGNTLQTPNSTAIGAGTIIDKANQAVIGNSQVTELKIGETLVIDKDQIVTGAEGVLVTKKVGDKTIAEVTPLTNFLNTNGTANTAPNSRVFLRGAIPGQNASGSALQVNGFMRIGNIFLHSGGLTPNSDFSSNFLSNTNQDLFWNKNNVDRRVFTEGEYVIVTGGIYATDAAAGAAGVPQNGIYKTTNGELKYKL